MSGGNLPTARAALRAQPTSHHYSAATCAWVNGSCVSYLLAFTNRHRAFSFILRLRKQEKFFRVPLIIKIAGNLCLSKVWKSLTAFSSVCISVSLSKQKFTQQQVCVCVCRMSIISYCNCGRCVCVCLILDGVKGSRPVMLLEYNLCLLSLSLRASL